jgi:hypothetical protein
MDEVPQVAVAPPSLEKIVREDEQFPSPYRFGILVETDIELSDAGRWTALPGGEEVLRLTVSAPGALALTAYFDRFRIPEGGKLFLYDPAKSRILGAFTSLNQSPDGLFATELIPGDRLVFEYVMPAGNNDLPSVHLDAVGYAYRGVDFLYPSAGSRNGAGECEVNVRCIEGDDWKKQKDGVVRIQVKRNASMYWCSGALLNNVRLDYKPYILTADHCGIGASSSDLEQWIFYFGYESPYCPNPPVPPIPNSMTGAKLKAHGGGGGTTGSDFFLVLLNASIPDSFDVFYNGWNRKDTTSPNGVGIHHPKGDLKKISTYKSKLTTSGWNGSPYMSHWKVYWSETINGHGVTEFGSSGSPLFSFQGDVVGNLTGGDSSCDSAALDAPDYYGKFSYSWESNGPDSATQLKYWLDPDNTGVYRLGGIPLAVPQPLPANPVIRVFPNPFGELLTIFPGGFTSGTCRVAVFNLFGLAVYEKEVSLLRNEPLRIGLGFLSPGMYILRISGSATVAGCKIIKQ